MSAWGANTFQNDAALDFINEEIDCHVRAIEGIFADEDRFALDEDAEGELMPRVEILLLLCEHCGGALPEKLNPATWKARYLAMYDDQMMGWNPAKNLNDNDRRSLRQRSTG